MTDRKKRRSNDRLRPIDVPEELIEIRAKSLKIDTATAVDLVVFVVEDWDGKPAAKHQP